MAGGTAAVARGGGGGRGGGVATAGRVGRLGSGKKKKKMTISSGRWSVEGKRLIDHLRR